MPAKITIYPFRAPGATTATRVVVEFAIVDLEGNDVIGYAGQYAVTGAERYEVGAQPVAVTLPAQNDLVVESKWRTSVFLATSQQLIGGPYYFTLADGVDLDFDNAILFGDPVEQASPLSATIALAASALQPEAIGTTITVEAIGAATAAQGAKADTALQPDDLLPTVVVDPFTGIAAVIC